MKAYTYTIPEICAKLGIKETCVGCDKEVKWGDNTGNSLDQLCQNPDCEYQYHRVLNVGDHWQIENACKGKITAIRLVAGKEFKLKPVQIVELELSE